MARPRKRAKPRRSTAPKVSRKMGTVKPLQGKPGVGRRYDPGFRTPPAKNPWQDEGEP